MKVTASWRKKAKMSPENIRGYCYYVTKVWEMCLTLANLICLIIIINDI